MKQQNASLETTKYIDFVSRLISSTRTCQRLMIAFSFHSYREVESHVILMKKSSTSFKLKLYEFTKRQLKFGICCANHLLCLSIRTSSAVNINNEKTRTGSTFLRNTEANTIKVLISSRRPQQTGKKLTSCSWMPPIRFHGMATQYLQSVFIDIMEHIASTKHFSCFRS